MSYCDNLLSKAIQPNCENPITRGIEANGYIINRKDLDLSTFSVENGVIKSLKLVTGKKAYAVHVPSNTPFSGTTTTLEAGTHRNSFTHNVGFIILDNGPEVVANVIEPLANGEFVIIYENKFKGNAGESAYQVVGLDQGLKASTLENDKWSEDTEGGWNVVMTETKSPRAAVFCEKATITALDVVAQTTVVQIP